MNILDFFKTKLSNGKPKQIDYSNEDEMRASGYTYNHLFNYSYDGEKTPGEIGTPKKYWPNFRILRTRAWQSYLESELTQDVMKKFVLWVIGSGLKLKAEPIESLLEGINRENFIKETETRFKLYGDLLEASHNKQRNLHSVASEVFKNAIIAGDCLVLLRVENSLVNAQVIDGDHVQTPFLNKVKPPAGNKIIDGVEINENGEQVAFHIRTRMDKFERVEARDSRGRLRAFMVYGLRYRLDNQRGIPLIVAVMETLKKLDRYKEATVASAEERAKIAFAIQHKDSSTGENPFIKNIAAGLNLTRKEDLDSGYAAADSPNKIMKTTQKQIINMPVDSELKSLSADIELNFKEFYETNITLICAAIGIPPEVALSKYDSNYSASRGAWKDWEHTLIVKRKDFADQFYNPIYSLWLESQVLAGEIKAPGYLDVKRSNDLISIRAYENSRFVGVKVPHIDPLKEVMAERLKLGPEGEHLPLTTAEQATENVAEGDFDSNAEQFNKETTRVEKTIIEQPTNLTAMAFKYLLTKEEEEGNR